MFRSIAKWEPCLIVDEADDALSDNPDLRSVINSGWTRGQGVIRCHPDTHEPELFSTFAPKIVAMKGRKLPDTTLSRSIVISMKPRRADDSNEHTADFNHIDNETFARLRSQLMRWTADNAAALAKATPEIPRGFYNRRRANWVPLLAIAEAGGGDWKTAAWKAAKAIEAVADTFDPSIGVELLRAIKAVFDAREASKDAITLANKDRVTSADLVAELVKDETAPWATWNKGKPISQRQVRDLLKSYGSDLGLDLFGILDGRFNPLADEGLDRPEIDLSAALAKLVGMGAGVVGELPASGPRQSGICLFGLGPVLGFHISTSLISQGFPVSTGGVSGGHVEVEKSCENKSVEVWKPESGFWGGEEVCRRLNTSANHSNW